MVLHIMYCNQLISFAEVAVDEYVLSPIRSVPKHEIWKTIFTASFQPTYLHNAHLGLLNKWFYHFTVITTAFPCHSLPHHKLVYDMTKQPISFPISKRVNLLESVNFIRNLIIQMENIEAYNHTRTIYHPTKYLPISCTNGDPPGKMGSP